MAKDVDLKPIVECFKEACGRYGGTVKARVAIPKQEVQLVCEGLSGEDRENMLETFKEKLTEE